jgi:hypothetical protein
MSRRWIGIVGASSVVASALALGVVSPAAAGPCDPGSNPIVCENSKPGSPESEWEVQDAGDPGLQGFATKMSVNAGETEQFKVKTSASSYTIDIYRLGWYGGDGARKVGSATPTARNQPNCLSDASTGLVDCGNWAVSASWTVPSDAVSGVYIAHLNNAANQDESQIPFVVRNDSSHSDILFQTSDATWQAYNTYGGSDFYQGIPDGRAYKISYNRPFDTRGNTSGRDYLFSNEFPMLQFMERNGYDVSYMSSYDVDQRGSLLLNHKVFTSTGHDEYWSAAQRSNVEAARDAGVNLAFFSGNEVYWHTRWEPSVDGTATPGRTLVSYKETWANAKIDPTPEWTGTWRDPRFASKAQGAGLPENGLTGTIYMSNFSDLPITVNDQEGKLRLWRNTGLSGMSPGQSTALAAHTIGYESDEDLDNGARPPGLIRLSTTTGAVPQYLQDYGNTVAPGTTTHHLTMYRASSGALVFGAGTVQWAWGLSQNHDGDGAAADPRMQQATINLFADMGASPTTLMPGMVAAAKSTDTTGPTTTITSPSAGASIANGTLVTVTGTAADTGGGRVAGVEVSTDNGATWHPATGTTSWTYQYAISGRGSVPVKVRAVDDSANIGAAATVAVSVSCPCSLFGDVVPSTPSVPDTSDVELGVRFVPAEDGYISGIRFYKGARNTGSHAGSLWTGSGSLLATGTFTNETSTGWQTLQFDQTVSVTAGTTYVASYRAPSGGYAADQSYFSTNDHVALPLKALGKPSGEINGVYGDGGQFPTSSYGDTNYYVDVLFSVDDTTPPVVTSRTPLPNSSSVAPASVVRATFSRTIDQSSLRLTVTGPNNTTVSGAVTYDTTSRTATFTPSTNLAYSTTYTASVKASSAYGVPMDAPSTWSFKTSATDPLPGACPCSVWPDSATPATLKDVDVRSVELGLRFTAEADGEVDGVRFYKGPSNVGTHVGNLWTSTGQLLASVTFTGESSSGWQAAFFSAPVPISADTTYVVSYRAPVGAYSYTANGLATAIDASPLHTVASGGIYTYGAGAPTTVSDTNYWVDVVYTPTDAAPSVAQTTPGSGATSVPAATTVTAAFSGLVRSGSAALAVKDSDGATVAGATTYDATSRTITFTPTSSLPAGHTFTATASGATALSGLVMDPYSWTFTTTSPSTCPCTLFDSTAAPPKADAGDGSGVTVGVRFSASVTGYVTGLRFYKSSANTGTHVGTLWSDSGSKLAEATFSAETASGWQTVTFAQPVQVAVGQTYVASYYAPNGHYAATNQFFANPWDNNVLAAAAGANGVYRYGSTNGFPTDSYASSNYWVDPVFQTGLAPDTNAPVVSGLTPLDGETSVATSAQPSATFSEDVTQSSLSLTVKDAANQSVSGIVSYDAATRTATFSPSAALSRGTKYTVTVTASDTAGNAMSPVAWSFTTAQPSPAPAVCPCSMWDDAAVPGIITDNDPSAIELGLQFTADVDGAVTGVRFYKGPKNTGTHTGSVWDSAGNRLATVTFSGESAAGWQTASFASPVAVTAGTTYVVSYTTTVGYYSATVNGLSAALDQSPLHTTAHAGLYLYGSGFPANVSDANYWVDVVFTKGGAPPAEDPAPEDTTAPMVSAVASAVSGTGATITWSTDESATTRVDYGPTTALGTSATGATGTAHSVSLGGLAAGTWYYRVTSADPAGNSTTDPVSSGAPRTFTVADTTAPSIGSVTATGSGTTATVSWTTNEAASSSVSYGTTTSLGSTATGAIGTSHSVLLSGLTPNTRYYYRVTSSDSAGNSTTSPATSGAPAAYVPSVSPITHTSVADFSTGSGTYVADSAGGEVIPDPVVGTELAGTTLPSSVTSTTVATGGSTTVAGGSATVSGSRLATSSQWQAGRSFAAAATLGAGQSLGWGSVATGATGVKAAFVMNASGALTAQVSSTGSTTQTTAVTGTFAGSEHTYRVDWNSSPTTAVFFVDDTQVASLTFTPSVRLRVLAVDPTTDATPLKVNWLRVAPYDNSDIFMSAVIDAGAAVGWDTLTRDVLAPSGTGIAISVRSGNTATPGTGWTGWSTVSVTSNSITRTARYLQYRFVLTASGSRFVTPAVRSIQIGYHVL